MNLTLLDTVLKTWWHDILPLGETITQTAMRMRDGRQSQVSSVLKAAGYYSLGPIKVLGTEENTYTDDPLNGKIVPVVTGIRTLSVSIFVDSYSQEPSKHALFLAERGRTRLALPKNLDFLAANGYSVIDRGSTISLPYVEDERMFSRAMFELRLGVLHVETETLSTESKDWIDTVEITSDTLDDETETPVVPQLSFDITR